MSEDNGVRSLRTVRFDWRASRSLRGRVPGAGALHHADTAKRSRRRCRIPEKEPRPELLAAVHDDVFAERGRRLLVLGGDIRVGLDQRVDP